MKKQSRLVGLSLFLALAATLVISTCAQFGSAARITPTSLPYQIDPGLEAAIDAAVQPFISEVYHSTAVPGAVVLVAKDGVIIAERAYGYSYLTDPPDGSEHLNVQALLHQGAFALNAARNSGTSTVSLNGRRADRPVPMTVDTLFDLASITKILATTQGIMKLVSDGLIDVDATVATYIPAFAQNGKENITVAQLLTHTSGLSQWAPMYLLVDNDRAAVLDYYNQIAITGTSGNYAYSDIGFRMLGFVIEAVTGMAQEEFLRREIYAPLGLIDTTFNPLENGFSPDRIAATSWGNYYEMAMVDPDNMMGFGYTGVAATTDMFTLDMNREGIALRDRGELGRWRAETLRGIVNDGNTNMANGGVGGAAGLFSTASDMAVLGQLMLNGGVYNGVKIYDADIVEMFLEPNTATTRSLGFKLNQVWMGAVANRSVNTIGHDGFTGTQFWFDTDTNMIIVVLTNKMNVGSGITLHAATGQYRPAYSNTLGAASISAVVANAVHDYLNGQ